MASGGIFEILENKLSILLSSNKIDGCPIDEAKSFAKDRSAMEKFKCVECGYRCHNSYDLELHLLRSHVDMEGYRCEFCGRIFMLETRLKKHMKMHESKATKVCKYFKKKMHCPYEERGCKFRHQNQLTAIQNL